MIARNAGRIALMAAAACMAFAPIAAQANTRASDFSTSYTSVVSGPATNQPANGSALGDDTDRASLWIALLGGIAIIIGIMIIQEDDDPDLNQSPGAN